jgi:signal transduction histidine kinase
MFRTLQNRLILSHLLPLLIIIPLTGIAFIYILETQVVLPDLADSLIVEGSLVAEFTSQQPDLWQTPDDLDPLMNRLKTQIDARIMLLDPDGKILASSDPSDSPRFGTILNDDDIPDVQNGEITQHIEFSKSLQQEVIDVFVPVMTTENEMLGMVRLSHEYTTIFDELLQMRLIILGILLLALVAGISLGSVLAITINTPIKQVTTAIDQLARGEKLEKLEHKGTEEIQSLVYSTNTLYERLHHLENARKQLLANLVHEIGRPLGALHSAIQSLKMGASKDPQLMTDLISGMDAQTARLQHLLDELAHMHDQIFGTLELDRQIIPTKVWLTNLFRPWSAAAQDKGLIWIQDIPDELPELNADPNRLAQAIENLISNAIKYTPPKGSVTVTVSFQNQRFELKVSDTGPGITLEDQDKIFIPFYRGAQRRRIKQGMGLGLSIAQDVVLAHGGEITLESQEGMGSHFTLSIPNH